MSQKISPQKTQSQTTSNNYDQRTAATDQATAIGSNSKAATGGGTLLESGATLNVQNLSGDVAKAALDSNTQATLAALSSSEGIVQSTVNANNKALDTAANLAGNAVQGSLNFAGSTVNNSLGFAQAANNETAGLVSQLIAANSSAAQADKTFANQQSQAAIDSVVAHTQDANVTVIQDLEKYGLVAILGIGALFFLTRRKAA